MSKEPQPKPVSNQNKKVYSFPELQVSVEAVSLEEATAKAKKKAKENE